MHMADALLTPAVGGAAWAASASLIGYSSRRLNRELDHQKIPLMAVMGAFVFAAQMINFTIPVTGSSGHLGGGLMLAILLGPYAGFLVIASVLTIQALFFADGGLLALGCNILNMGFFSCFIVYPLIYKKIVGENSTRGRIVTGSLAAAIAGLQLGSFGVVVETLLSGITELPFFTFLALMQPIHLAIGVVEGLVTAMLVVFIWKARPEILVSVRQKPLSQTSMKGIVLALMLMAAITAGGLSWFASTHPDGLEWAMRGASGKEKLDNPGGGVHSSLENLQAKTSILPDYGFKSGLKSNGEAEDTIGELAEENSHWPAVDPGTTVSGLLGGTLTLLLAGAVGFAVRRRSKTTGE